MKILKKYPNAAPAALAGLFFAVVGFLIYSNILHSPFVMDDWPGIVSNRFIRNLGDFRILWDAFNTRFLTGLTFALNYSWGGIDPFGYHLFNIAVHVVNSLLVYRLALSIFETPSIKNGDLAPHRKAIAFFSGALFLVHPLQTQAVTYIWQRAASLACLFYLLTLILYIRARLTGKGRHYAGALLACFAGMFTKEIVFTLPIALCVAEYAFFEESPQGRAHRWTRLAPFLSMLLVIPIARTLWPHPLMPLMQRASMDLTRFAPAGVMRRGDYWLTQLNVMRTYVRLLFLPVNQNLDYDYPLVRHFTDPGVIVSLGFLLALFFGAARLYKKNKIAGFGLIFFFLTLSLESLIIQTDVIVEQRLYLPMAGFVIFFASAAFLLFKSRARTVKIIAAFLIVALSVATYRRNRIWENGIRLWKDVIQKSPHKARPYINLAIYYRQAGRTEEADRCYAQAAELPGGIRFGGSNADMDSFVGQLSESRGSSAASDKTPAPPPENAEAYFEQGLADDGSGMTEKAIADYGKSIALRPDDERGYNNRGACYLKEGLLDPALADYEKALALNPSLASAYSGRATVYQRKGDLSRALSDYDRSIALAPGEPIVYYNRAIVYFKEKEYRKSLSDIEKAESLGFKVPEAIKERVKKASTMDADAGPARP